MNNQLFQRVKSIISTELGVDESQIQLDSHLQEDLNSDPLSMADLMVKLEKEFDFKIPTDTSANFNTVEDIVNLISEQTGEI